MKILSVIVGYLLFLFSTSTPVFAATPDLTAYTNQTLQILTVVASVASVFFLIKAGYLYITSTGNPEALDSAKSTIRKTLIGLVLVLSANVIVSIFQNALVPSGTGSTSAAIEIAPIQVVEPSEGLTQILIDAVTGFIRTLVETSTQPVVDGIISYLTNTPSVLHNSVVSRFWLVSLGIANALYALVIAVLGLQLMSASSFGFEELELKQLLPKLGLAFLGTNISLFLADYVIVTCNTLVKVVLDSTGGLGSAWIMDAVNPVTLLTGTTPLINLIFLVLFLIVAVVLLLLYVSRLIMISLSAVLSPFLFLLWVLPKFSDMAVIAVKTYLVTVFIAFVHVVVIQLAAAFLTLPEHNENSIVSVTVALGLMLTLLKVPSVMTKMVFYTSGRTLIKKISSQVINVMTTNNSSTNTREQQKTSVKTKRKTVTI